ncbi:MAG TPA: flagellar basal body-associated FliL family protein [Pseudomonadales bacterium]|nr:flagellar basal body-associated FliL family protein [Pseudomonadales bacterium]
MAKATTKTAAAGAGAGGGSKKRLLIMAAAAIALLVVGVTAGVLLGGRAGAQKPADEQAEAAPAKAIYVSLGDKFVVMLQYEGRRHYLQTMLSVLTHDGSVTKQLEVHAPLIRGRLVALLGEQDFAALRTDAGRVLLRERILATIREILQKETGKPGVEQVFFTDLVLQ